MALSEPELTISVCFVDVEGEALIGARVDGCVSVAAVVPPPIPSSCLEATLHPPPLPRARRSMFYSSSSVLQRTAHTRAVAS